MAGASSPSPLRRSSALWRRWRIIGADNPTSRGSCPTTRRAPGGARRERKDGYPAGDSSEAWTPLLWQRRCASTLRNVALGLGARGCEVDATGAEVWTVPSPRVYAGSSVRRNKKVLFRQFNAGVGARAPFSRVKNKKTGFLFTTCMARNALFTMMSTGFVGYSR